MNWVGGSRRRFMKNREDTIKQKAFFQKQRMKTKSKNVDPQTSPNGKNTGNMDLLTLFIVNQIASKKKHTDKPKINLFNAKENKKTLNEPLELPMSPGSPSDLNLLTSQPQYSVDTLIDTPGFQVRQNRISKDFKFKPLSPVLESNLSDVSGSENQPHILSAISPFPPTSSLNPFGIQPGPASLPSQEKSDPDSIKFVPFSQPTKQMNPWTVSKEANVLQTNPVAEIQFGVTLPNTNTVEQLAHSVLYPTSPLKSGKQHEEPLFIDFSNKDHEVGIVDGNGFMSVCDSPGRGYLISDDGEVDQCPQCVCSNKHISHTEDVWHRFLSVNNSTFTAISTALSQAPSHKIKAKSNCGCQNETEAQMHAGNAEKSPPIMQDAGTQTASVPALSCCDVSVQCSLINTNSVNAITFPTDDDETGVNTTRWQSVHFNEIPSGASATKDQGQTHPKLLKALSFSKPHQQTSMRKPPTPKRPLRKGLPTESRAAVGKQSENREV